jgi:YegS/Rv2252/BmrU family lipid kinase
MKKLLFIFNPLAGKGAIRGHLPGVIDAFTKEGYLTTAYPTQSKGDATRIAAELGGQFDRVVCCGGDGTLSETAAGLLTLDDLPPLGYVPAGTTNDFARNLKLPKTLEAAAQTAVTGPVRHCDMGQFNGKPFLYVAAFGAFTDVSYDTPQEFKNALGHLAYVLEGVSRLGSIQSYHLTVTHDDGMLEGDFFYGMVSNTVSVGGFKGLPTDKVKLDDGQFEVVLVRQPKSLPELQSIITTLLQQKAVDGGAVITFHTAHLKVECQDPLPWTLDGEYGGDPRSTRIDNDWQAIRLVYGE